MSLMNQHDLRNALKVYFIMGTQNCFKKPYDVLVEAISGGITCFQFREKGQGSLKGMEKYAQAEEFQFLCQNAQIPFIVNDDIDLALSLNADGVHIGQEDESVQSVRERIGNKILGVSIHNMEEATSAIQAGADYFGVGPIFPTQSKADAQAVQGVQIIQELRQKGIHIPIVGIGGITSKNAASVINAGADGVSVISAISQSQNPKFAVEQLKESMNFKINY